MVHHQWEIIEQDARNSHFWRFWALTVKTPKFSFSEKFFFIFSWIFMKFCMNIRLYILYHSYVMKFFVRQTMWKRTNYLYISTWQRVCTPAESEDLYSHSRDLPVVLADGRALNRKASGHSVLGEAVNTSKPLFSTFQTILREKKFRLFWPTHPFTHLGWVGTAKILTKIFEMLKMA